MGNFNFESFPKDKKSELQKESKAWKTVQHCKDVATFTALLLFFGLTPSLAQEKSEKNQGDQDKNKIEQLQKEAAGYTKNISVKMLQKGRSGTIGKTPVKEWKTADEQLEKRIITTIGLNGEKTTWIMCESADGVMSYLDTNADGKVDKFVRNKTNPDLNVNQKRAENGLDIFIPIDDLKEQAEVEASLDPKPVSVFDFKTTADGKTVVKAVDLKSGEASELSGEEAESFYLKAQSHYTDVIKKVAEEINK